MADANGLQADASLVAGSSLTVPEVKTSSNDASTFKPYDPSEITGPTAPSLPYIAPPNAGCNVLSVFIMAVVAAVVMTYAPLLAQQLPAFGAQIAAGSGTFGGLTVGAAATASAIVGAGASAVGNGIVSLLGEGSFSWRQVASDGLAAGLAAGLSQVLAGLGRGAGTGATYQTAASGTRELTTLGRTLQGVGNYAGGVVANAAVGRDTDFRWSAVAASALGAYASAKLGGRLPAIEGGTRADINLMTDWRQGFINSASNATAKRLMGGGTQHWGEILADSFGNALGNAVGAATVRSAPMATSMSHEALMAWQSAGQSPNPYADFAAGGQYSTVGRSSLPLAPEALLQQPETGSGDGVNPFDALLTAGSGPTRSPSQVDYMTWSEDQKVGYWSALTQSQQQLRDGMGGDPYATAIEVAQMVSIREQLDTRMNGISMLSPEAALALQRQHGVLSAALIAKDVYFGTSIPELLPQGIARITDDASLFSSLGLRREDLIDDRSGFYSAAYHDTDRNSYIIANRGTEMKSDPDWIANLLQGIGRTSDQYERALSVALTAQKKVGDKVSFVGHSLGGGLASAQAIATSLNAVTFNSSGVHASTVARFSVHPSDGLANVRAFYVGGEVLSALQDDGKNWASASVLLAATSTSLWNAASVAAGKPVAQLLAEMPAASGQRIKLQAREAPTMSGQNGEWITGAIMRPHTVPAASIGLHGMSSVVFALYGETGWTQAAPPVAPPAVNRQVWPTPTRTSSGYYRY